MVVDSHSAVEEFVYGNLTRRHRLAQYSVLSGGQFMPKSPIPITENARCFLYDEKHDILLTLPESLFARHMLLAGSIGTGKTNAINWLLYQIKSGLTPDDVLVVFDTKGDFYNEFYAPGDIVISNDETATGYWNIFEEMALDSNPEDYAREAASTLFAEKIKKSNQPFFPNAARDLLAGLMIFFHRLEKQYGIRANNEVLKTLTDSVGSRGIRGLLAAHEDLKGIVSYIEQDDSPQTQGVISEFQQGVREVFIGNFRKAGDLSIRKHIRNKGGKTIFVEYDISYGNVLTPIYVLLIDQALKEAMGRQRGKGNVWIVIDEFRLLPRLQYIESAINFGRSLGVKVIIAMQNINQINEAYGENIGYSILSGCSTVMAFRLTDQNSRKYFSELFGKQRRLEIYASEQLEENMRQVQEGNVVEDWMLNQLPIGSAIIGFPFSQPILFQFPEYQRSTKDAHIARAKALASEYAKRSGAQPSGNHKGERTSVELSHHWRKSTASSSM